MSAWVNCCPNGRIVGIWDAMTLMWRHSNEILRYTVSQGNEPGVKKYHNNEWMKRRLAFPFNFLNQCKWMWITMFDNHLSLTWCNWNTPQIEIDSLPDHFPSLWPVRYWNTVTMALRESFVLNYVNSQMESRWPRRSKTQIIRATTVYDDVIKWKHFPRNWPFVRGIHRSPVNSPHKDQWRGALMCFLWSSPE